MVATDAFSCLAPSSLVDLCKGFQLNQCWSQPEVELELFHQHSQLITVIIFTKCTLCLDWNAFGVKTRFNVTFAFIFWRTKNVNNRKWKHWGSIENSWKITQDRLMWETYYHTGGAGWLQSITINKVTLRAKLWERGRAPSRTASVFWVVRT